MRMATVRGIGEGADTGGCGGIVYDTLKVFVCDCSGVFVRERTGQIGTFAFKIAKG